ncbi:MAG: hypothetical protein LBD52_08460 [Prevotellaceae bacterium]|nr:hypothetical protein [Prevotellaceae bacterium]
MYQLTCRLPVARETHSHVLGMDDKRQELYEAVCCWCKTGLHASTSPHSGELATPPILPLPASAGGTVPGKMHGRAPLCLRVIGVIIQRLFFKLQKNNYFCNQKYI